MNAIGTRVDETGTLLREAGGFSLRRDLGGRWKLDLHRVPVDHIEKRVRITGTIVGEDLVDVDGFAPDIEPSDRRFRRLNGAIMRVCEDSTVSDHSASA